MSSKGRKRRDRNQCLSWYRYESRDPYDNRFWTAFSISVMAPTYMNPRAVVMVSMSGASGKVTCRVESVEKAAEIINIPQDAFMRLEEAFGRAKLEAFTLRQNMLAAARMEKDDILVEVEKIGRDCWDT